MWNCGKCGCSSIAASLEKCPHCGEEREMAKTTVTGGASNGTGSAEAAVEVSDVPAAPKARAKAKASEEKKDA